MHPVSDAQETWRQISLKSKDAALELTRGSCEDDKFPVMHQGKTRFDIESASLCGANEGRDLSPTPRKDASSLSAARFMV